MSDQTLQLAIQHHLRNNFQQAFELYKTVLDSSPGNCQANHLMGLVLIQNGFQELGHQYLERALSIEPNCREALHNQGVLRDPFRGRYLLEENNIVDSKYGGAKLEYPARRPGTVDDWRHMRMLAFTRHLAKNSDRWLTVGDHYGHDAQRLLDHGVTVCTPSSLSTEYLEAAREGSLLDNFLKINAEDMPLEDESYDVVVCKEALHHMPRPYRAIYEMLRVARKAVIFIEPNDSLIDWKPETSQSKLKREFVIDELVGESVVYSAQGGEKVMSRYIDWWEDGPNNYVYTLSEREITKIASGYGLPSFGTLTFNDFYSPEYGGYSAQAGSDGYDKTLEQIQLHDLLCEQSGVPKSYVVGVLFKQTPSTDVRDALSSAGLNIRMTRTRLLPLAWPTFT